MKWPDRETDYGGPTKEALKAERKSREEFRAGQKWAGIEIVPGTSDMTQYNFKHPVTGTLFRGDKGDLQTNPNDPTLSFIVDKYNRHGPNMIIGQIDWDTKPNEDWICPDWDNKRDVSIKRLDIYEPHKGKGYGTIAKKKQHGRWKQQGKRSSTLYPEAYSNTVQEQIITGKKAKGKARHVPDKQHLALGRFYNKLGYDWSELCRRKDDDKQKWPDYQHGSNLFTKWLL